MAGYPDDGDGAGRTRWSFGKLLSWHLNVHGTRPDGSPDRPGRKWSPKEFADKCGVSDKTVRNWLGDKNPPVDIETIENALFGKDVARYAEWRLELRQAYADTQRKIVAPPPPDGAVTPLSNPPVIEGPVAAAERQTIAQAFSRLHNAPAVVILAQDHEGLGSAAVVREIGKHAVEHFRENRAVHLLSPIYVSGEDGIAPYFASLLEQLDLSTTDASSLNFQLRLSQRLKGGEQMCLVFTGIERGPPDTLKSLCGSLRALNEQHAELRILMCGGERLCDMRYANGALSYLSHAQEVRWPDPDVPEILVWAAALDCGALEPGLIELPNELAGGHAGLIRELLRKLKAGERSRDALTRAVFDSPATWTAVTPLLDNADAASYLRSIVDRDDLGEAQPYIRNATLRRLFWRNLVKRQPSGDEVRLVWRSPAVRGAVRRIIRSGEADGK